MYEYKEKTKKSKRRAVANSIAQKKSNGEQGFGFVDNRSEGVAQRDLQRVASNNAEKGSTLQRVFAYDEKFQSPTELHGGPQHGRGVIRDYFNRWNPTGLEGNLQSDVEYWVREEAASFGLTRAQIDGPNSNYRVEISIGLHYDDLKTEAGPHFTIKIYNVITRAQIGGTRHMYVAIDDGYILGVTRVTPP